MLSKTATDVLSECDYERVRTQLHHALHGDGNPSRGARVWQAGRLLFNPCAADQEWADAYHDHHASV